MIPAEPGTIRTGGHWRVTIVDEGVQPPDATGHRPDARLRAVVMDGKVLTTDPELAELVATFLNRVEQQRRMVEHGRTLIPDVLAAEPVRCGKCGGALDACADCGKPAQCGEPWCAKHSPDGDWSTPPRPLSAPVGAQEAPVDGSGRPGGVEAPTGDSLRCPACILGWWPDHSHIAMTPAHLAGRCPDMSLEDQDRFQVEGIGLHGAPGDLSLRCDRCPWTLHTADQLTLAELNQRAREHTDACRTPQG